MTIELFSVIQDGRHDLPKVASLPVIEELAGYYRLRSDSRTWGMAPFTPKEKAHLTPKGAADAYLEAVEASLTRAEARVIEIKMDLHKALDLHATVSQAAAREEARVAAELEASDE